ncbi:MAG: hypothetical protein HQL39_16845, partial [Alphaproteobacteria bacterium]|nr:hypothetical protein [Alphaproteobacteria bacterium]
MTAPLTMLERLERHRRLVALRLLTEQAPEQSERRAVLSVLADAGQQMCNAALVQEVLVDRGRPMPRERIAAAMVWLADAGLAVMRPAAVPGCQLTGRGVE